MQDELHKELTLKIREVAIIVNDIVKSIPFDDDISNDWVLKINATSGELTTFSLNVENITFSSKNLNLCK